MGKKVDWDNVWSEFCAWLSKLEDIPNCSTCNGSMGKFPEWDEQEKKIQEIVDAQVSKIIADKI